jgi:amidase
MVRDNSESVAPNQLNRRTFLATSAASGMLAATMPTSASARGNESAPQEPFHAPSSELGDITIAELQQGLKSGEFTSRSLVERYLSRINALDQNGPRLRSVIETNPDALDVADQLDQERRSKVPRGPLHGIPVLIKDNIDTADRMATTAGSLALVGAKPPEDAFVVKQLRKAGAIIIGKTNLSEWANIRSKNSTSGWSGRGGLTRNPYVLDRNPSGSSSGSAVAVSAALCAVAVGTETDGSILCPSSACGIVGIKPTVGLVSRTGIIPISHSQDTAGPMARTARDAAILLGVLAGVDEQDAVTQESSGHARTDYTAFLDESGLQGARLGVARNFFGFHEDVDSLMDSALEAMKNAGATLVDTDMLSDVSQAGPAKGTVFKFELKAGMASYLSRLGADAPVKTLKDIIEFNDRHKDQEMSYFGQDFFLAAEAKGPLTEYEYQEALAKCRRLARTEGIDAALEKLQLDALIAPTTGPAWVTDLVCGDNWLGSSTSPAAIAGYPSVTVPAGSVFGLPVGISFFGRAWSEPTLLKYAYAFEQATKLRRPPQFRPTIKQA